MTNVQRFCQANESLTKQEWIEEFMMEFDVDYAWAEYKYHQTH